MTFFTLVISRNRSSNLASENDVTQLSELQMQVKNKLMLLTSISFGSAS